ncbi:MAG TPA: glycerophosphodiester phosphodiesterase [Syntrophomonadaceae bacterium]|nr:glycerophosphodiester phosphodiesterase [Syntrophomonadaceae bacterium]
MTDNKTTYKDREAILTKLPFAHRGLHTNNGEVPENSLLAFTWAIKQGYAIELDVQLSADGKVMVFHDENLFSMTGIDKKLADTNSAELRKLSLLDSEQDIPYLEEVLSLTAGQVPLLIEIKNEGRVGKLEKTLLAVLKKYSGPFAIQSFNPLTVGYFKKMAPEIIRGQLSGSFDEENLPVYKKFFLKYLLLNFISCPRFVAYENGCMPGWLAFLLKRRKIPLLVWTVRSQEETERLPAYIDNIIFELFSAKIPFRKTAQK